VVTNVILIVLAVILGVAYFSIRNRRKQRERQMLAKRRTL
jgi:preprotein translocase subunit YajC